MKKFILTFVVLLTTTIAFAQNLPPAIFHSNLTSGPNTGGQNNAGAFVTIHGKGFGASRGSSAVTIGGGNAAGYQSWSDSSVTFQLGSAAKTGSIVVNVGGVASNSVPFTVRAGNIYFISTQGSDRKSGSYSSPWRTAAHAASVMHAGDIVYLENGYVQSTALLSNTALVLSPSGTASAPMAMVAYPNSVATIGSSSGPALGISVAGSNWVLSGLTLRGAETAVSLGNVSGVRLIGNDVSCPNGSGSGACIATNGGSSFTILGNAVHDNGLATATSLSNYQAMYLLGTHGVEIGWNVFANTRGCNAIGAHANTGAQYSYSIHDNYIYNTRCEAIALGTVDPSQGAVTIYNNILRSSGTGPAPPDAQTYGYAALVVGGGSSVPAQIYNNTIYDSGSFGGGNAGAVRAFGAVNLVNNIFDLLPSEQYVSADTNLSWITGSNNLFAGAGNPLGVFSNSVVGDPMFADLASNNFHLLTGSPAIDSGATVQLAADYDGVLRPQGAGYDIGAYEFPSQTPSSQAAGTLSASPASLSFGSVTTGQTATTTTVLSNTGNTNLTISQVNSNNSNFQTSGMSFPLTLGAGQSATLSVAFLPTSGGAQSGTLAVASNASNPSMNIAVSGTAVSTAPAVSLSATSLTFASQAVSTTSAAQSVTLTNTGNATLSVSSIAASGDFAQTNTCGSSLAAGTACTISVTFTPTTSGTRTGAITFTDNGAASPQQVSLSGTGAAGLAITSTSLPVATVGAPYSTTLTAANGTSPYTWSDPSCSGSCNTGMNFSAAGVFSGTPVNAGTSTFTFKVVDAVGNTATKQLTITVAAPGLVITSTSLPAGVVGIPYSATLTAANGTAPYTWSDPSCSGSCNTGMNFSAAGVFSGTPVNAGTSTFTFKVVDAVGNTATTQLTITISAPTGHSVSLAWTAPSTSVSGYNVYRSTQSGTGYTKLNSSLATGQNYSDTVVVNGQTYYYVLTSVDSVGNESAYSSQVTAVVPTT